MNTDLLLVLVFVLAAVSFLGRSLLLHTRSLLRLASSKSSSCAACSGCAKGALSALRKRPQ